MYFKHKQESFKINNPDKIDNILFVVIAATAFTSCVTHWLLDIAFKYTVDDNGVNIDFNTVSVLLMGAGTYYLFKKGSIHFDMELALLLQSMVLIAVWDYQNQNYSSVCYAWILPLSYIIGKLVIGREQRTVNYRIFTLYFAMAFPLYVAAIMDFAVNWKVGWALGTERWVGYWTAQVEPRTTFEYGFVLITASLGYWVMHFKKHKVLACGIFAMEILALYILVKVEGRQNPILVIITLMVTAGLWAIDSWKNVSPGVKRWIYRGIAGVVVLVLLLVLLFSLNVGGIQQIYAKSYWADGGLLKNERFLINWMGFKHMMRYPLLDYTARYGYYYSHSLMLEYGRLFGLTIWGLLTIFRILLFVQAFKMAIRKSANSWIKYLVVPAFLAVNIYYTMEPNGAAHRYFWMVGLFISGMIKGWLELEEDNDYIPKMDKKII